MWIVNLGGEFWEKRWIGTDFPEDSKALMSGAFLFATDDGMKMRYVDDCRIG
jgi:hypothetical protein